MSQNKVRRALETKLNTFALSKNIPVVWENIKTVPTTSYLRAFLMPADTQDPSIGNNHRRFMGGFRVVYYCTDINKGITPVETFMDELVDYFPRALKLVEPVSGITVNIDHTPSVSSPNYEATYIYTAMDVLYRADVFN